MDLYSNDNYISRIGFLTGVLSLIMWVVPTLSIFLNFISLYYGIKMLDIEMKHSGVILTLGIIGTLLTVIRTIIVYILI